LIANKLHQNLINRAAVQDRTQIRSW